MNATHQLRCTNCGVRIAADAGSSDFRCPDCNGLYEVIYPWSPSVRHRGDCTADVRLPNPGGMRHLWQERRTSTMAIDQSGVWRFRELLPIVRDVDRVVTLREGNTPLYEMPRCAEIAGVDWLLAKHQGMNPTSSFKDTGMTAALSVAVERGFQWVACASTGNTSAAMAAYAARAGLRSIVFIPEGKIAWGKLSQSMDYGAMTVQLKTDFDGCVRLLQANWCGVSPSTCSIRSTHTGWRVRRRRRGDGGAVGVAGSRAHRGARRQPRQLLRAGQGLPGDEAPRASFPALPKISVIQAQGANPLYRWFNDTNRDMQPMKAETRATAIRIGNPASWKKAARVIEEMGGWCEQASEQEIALAKAEIGAEGVGCEPASAVTLAGLKKLVVQGRVSREERVVLLLTGHTLKDSQYTIDYHRGDLLSKAELAGATEAERAQHQLLRKPPIVLEADEAVVLKTLEQQMARANSTPMRRRRPRQPESRHEPDVRTTPITRRAPRPRPAGAACHLGEPRVGL